MRIKILLYFLLSTFIYSQPGIAQKNTFPVCLNNKVAGIVYDRNASKLDSIVAHLLAADIESVTKQKPNVYNSLDQAKGNIIVISSVNSALVQQLMAVKSSFTNSLSGKWECYGLKILESPIPNIQKALLICGSDTRGTAYGVFSITEKLGVSPWYWWADVPVKFQKELVIQQPDYFSVPPSVQYRGIFINDEDWGLLPWASKTFEPEKNNIGPKTYAKVFELMLRLKANLLWPAMHPGTIPFYKIEGNAEMAANYEIIIGSSHAEPMLRNNVGEWDEKTMGHFNYITNKSTVYQYWEERIRKSKTNNVIYTLGMRGVHDSGIEGVKNAKDAVPLVEQIIEDQRGLLRKYINDSLILVPQAFTAYKEVLDIYDLGLKVPDDVIMVWPDDNYGYIQRLNNEIEKKRKGGSGVYYHASYWGRPHDYLWLGTTHPLLIREEMMKAYSSSANRLWVLNVGDIKPLEYNIQFFFDMAYNITPFRKTDYTKVHLNNWAKRIFGIGDGDLIADALWEYYNLAFERRPEFMGWSQTEPTTKTFYTDYNHFYFGDEAERRINRYENIVKTVKTLRSRINTDKSPSFYELVYYPVMGAAWMNKKFLYRDKAYLYAKQNRISAYDYAKLSLAAYDSIIKETTYFNEKLAAGKWKGIMSMIPRDLPVFQPPNPAVIAIHGNKNWEAVPEGYDTSAYKNNIVKVLPEFLEGMQQSFFIDVYLGDSIEVDWKASVSADWIRLSAQNGKLIPLSGKNSKRIWVSVDWKKFSNLNKEGKIVFSGSGKNETIIVKAARRESAELGGGKKFIESNNYVSIHANHFLKKEDKNFVRWEETAAPAYTSQSIRSEFTPGTINPTDTSTLIEHASNVMYEFISISTSQPKVIIYTLPSHPINKNYSMRYGVSMDNGPVKIVDFKTFGRSEEWKQNVLRNNAQRSITFPSLKPGRHSLKIYAIDPGVVLDRILIDFGLGFKAYGVIPETCVN